MWQSCLVANPCLALLYPKQSLREAVSPLCLPSLWLPSGLGARRVERQPAPALSWSIRRHFSISLASGCLPQLCVPFKEICNHALKSVCPLPCLSAGQELPHELFAIRLLFVLECNETSAYRAPQPLWPAGKGLVRAARVPPACSRMRKGLRS